MTKNTINTLAALSLVGLLACLFALCMVVDTDPKTSNEAHHVRYLQNMHVVMHITGEWTPQVKHMYQDMSHRDEVVKTRFVHYLHCDAEGTTELSYSERGDYGDLVTYREEVMPGKH